MNITKITSVAATLVIVVVAVLLAVMYRDGIAGLWSATEQGSNIVYLSGTSFMVTVADTPEERRQGLSNTEQIADFSGKLFIFDSNEIHGIWMKDMNYGLDILWFDENQELIHIEQNVQPESYTRNRTIFRPTIPSRYVLEVNAGTVDALDINLNDKLILPPHLIQAESDR